MELFSKYLKLTPEEMLLHQTLLINAIDREHTIVFWNDLCAAHFGISREEAIGKKLEDIFPEVKDFEQMDRIKRAFTGKEIMLYRQPYKRKQGFFDQLLIPVKNEREKVIAILNVVNETR